jgi:CheY-like chemotaxis protein
MESVGRLAGGVAHDFNNMLSVILGYTELELAQLDKTQPLFKSLKEIRRAATRSADLTRQLLAFARKQTVTPKVLDLNKTLEGMLKMLRRLLGEDIDLIWRPEEDLWPVKLDASQVDQLLTNLCVNARDAIRGVGRITIETARKDIDDDYCRGHQGFLPGKYVMIAVSDDGCGMDKETRDKIFEPFFTTKGSRQGTGLGLSTVYGIVRQNNGLINVYSEPGQGSTFRIYLPSYLGQAIEEMGPEAETIPRGNGEMVLIVEDEPLILKLAERILHGIGYTVLPADSPKKALQMAAAHTGDIALVITDVVMPELNGRELAASLTELYPDIKCLFMSGYTSDVIAHHGVLDEGVNFIQKPFTTRELALKVSEVIRKE